MRDTVGRRNAPTEPSRQQGNFINWNARFRLAVLCEGTFCGYEAHGVVGRTLLKSRLAFFIKMESIYYLRTINRPDQPASSETLVP